MEYVRRIVRYKDLLNNVKAKLHDDVTNYVICTWFNHWTTVLIEEHISIHKKIIPTIKNIKGIDNFFDTETVSHKDEIVFTFGKKTYTAVTKVLIITK